MTKRQLKCQPYRIIVEGTSLVTRVGSLCVTLREAESLARTKNANERAYDGALLVKTFKAGG